MRVAVKLRECNNGDDDDEGFDIGTIAANDGANATTPYDRRRASGWDALVPRPPSSGHRYCPQSRQGTRRAKSMRTGHPRRCRKETTHPHPRPSPGDPRRTTSRADRQLSTTIRPLRNYRGRGGRVGGHRAGVDALRCSTMGSLRHKRTLSFDLSRVSLTLAMRRLIFEGEDRAANARIGPTTAHPPPSAAAATGESHPPCHRPDHARRRRRRIRCPDRPVARP